MEAGNEITTLREARKARGWTQEQLAEKADIARETLSRFESGERIPSNAQAFVLAALFNVRVGEVERWCANAAPAVKGIEAAS